MNGAVVVQDKDFESSQAQKLEESIRCTAPFQRAKSVQSTRVKKLVDSLQTSCRNSKENIAALCNVFKDTDLNLNPTDRHLFQYESTQERVQKSVQENRILDTTPGMNHQNIFSQILRSSQRDRSKDLGPSAFRFSDTGAERLLRAELDPLNMEPPRGINKFNKTKAKLFMPQTTKWFMPQSVEGRHQINIDPSRSAWTKNLPVVQDARRVHAHLHNKTHFKSTHTFFLQADSEKVNLEDQEVSKMIKDIQTVMIKKQKSVLKVEKENQANGQVKNKLAKMINQLVKERQLEAGKPPGFVIKKEQKSDSEEDPEVSLTEFKKATKQLLQNANVLRRPSVQIRGPHQTESQHFVYSKMLTNKYK